MNRLSIQLLPGQELKEFMTAEQYAAFAERFRLEVKPFIDKQREARARSEDQARRHLVD